MSSNVITRGDKHYQLVQDDGDQLKLQASSADGKIKPGRPVYVDKDGLQDWIDSATQVHVDFGHKQSTVRFIKYDESSGAVIAKKLVDGNPQRGRPMKIFLEDLEGDYRNEFLELGLIPDID